MDKTTKLLNNHLKDSFTMHQATEKDREHILTLLTETANWFKSKGSSQWSGLLDGIDTHNTANAIERGDVFVCKNNSTIAGMVMLLQTPSEWDRNLWKLQDEDNTSLYLHRLAINRKYANENLGQSILNWCKTSIQFKGKDKIRLDCIANNEFLNDFYQRAGFTYMGENEGYSLYETGI